MMATYMVHWVTRPDYDRFLETGDLPPSGCFAEEMPRSSMGLVKHARYSRHLRIWAGDEAARGKVSIAVHSVQIITDDRVFVVCSFD